METTQHQLATGHADAKAKHTISVQIICMDGGDVSREDRVRVRVSLAGDSDDWKECERLGGVANPAAVSRVGVVDEAAAVCRWDRPGDSARRVRARDNVFHATLTCYIFSRCFKCMRNLQVSRPATVTAEQCTPLSFVNTNPATRRYHEHSAGTRSSAARKSHLWAGVESY